MSSPEVIGVTATPKISEIWPILKIAMVKVRRARRDALAHTMAVWRRHLAISKGLGSLQIS